MALVKQDCNEDLYCCPPESPLPDILESTLLRSGPVALFTRFDTRFLIVRTHEAPECQVWREKVDPLNWAPAAWFEAFRDHVPGRDHGQSRFAQDVDEVDWSQFDLVISIDVAIPARVTLRYPGVVWAYYIRELKAPSWRASFERPLAGQDLYLTHAFSPERTRAAAHVIDFPYHFQYPGVFHEVFGEKWPDDDGRRGVFVDYHSARSARAEELQALSAFGPVYACRADDDQFDPVNGERIPQRSMSPEGRRALFESRYHVKWGGRGVFGTAKVEAISAGCVALADRARDSTLFLHSQASIVDDFPSVLRALERFESDRGLLERERARQRLAVEYLCFLRPANDLVMAWRTIKNQKAIGRPLPC